jgi:hypothetical protein
LIAAGKKYKVALVAAMRKMITVLNVMIKTKTYWKEQNTVGEKYKKRTTYLLDGNTVAVGTATKERTQVLR